MKADDRPLAQSPLPATPRPFGFEDIVRAYADRIVDSRVKALYAARPEIEAHVREAIQYALDRKAEHDAAVAAVKGE